MNPTETRLAEQLAALKLAAVQEHYPALASEAAQKQWTHVDYLARLIDGEAQRRQPLAIARRLAAARFPCLKTLDAFDWTWPKKINRTQVQNLFRLAFLQDHTNVIFLGGVGLGKSHLACALGHAALFDRRLHHS
jgi:DNA replication protein DnaC